ncbi:MAG: ABC transporter permease [Phototrophicaceae bacterium]|jgi:spermidine/putrescine transport system permease protein
MATLSTAKRKRGFLESREPGQLNGFGLALPAIFWMIFFFILPVLIVLVMSFLTRTRSGGELPLTLKAYDDVFGEFYEADEVQESWQAVLTAESGADRLSALGDLFEADNPYARVLVRSLWIALVSTVACLVLGYPLAYYIATRQSELYRVFTLFLVVLPFWTNFLVRTYAWRVMLGTEGVINTVLVNTGVVQEPLQLLFTQGAVIVGLVYGFLPFMVLPIYASVSRFNFRLVEAANDLGANDWFAFWRVVLPGTLPGVIAGCILVFIPCIGSYVTPDLLGGGAGDRVLIGNLIAEQFGGSAGNYPRGSALSVVLMAIVLGSLFVYLRFGQEASEGRGN